MTQQYTTSHNLDEQYFDGPFLIVVPTGAEVDHVIGGTPNEDFPGWLNEWGVVWSVSDDFDPDDDFTDKIVDYYAVQFGDTPTVGEWTTVGQVYKSNKVDGYPLTDVHLSFIGTGVWADKPNNSIG